MAVALGVALAVPPALAASADRQCRDGAIRATDGWDRRRQALDRLTRWQSFGDSVRWRMTADGLVTDRGRVRIAASLHDRLASVPLAWRRYGTLIRAAARRYRVPVELFLAIIVNESSLNPRAFQTYPGYIDDRRTPTRVSVGLGAVLISTARYLMRDPTIDRAWLEDPANNIRMIGIYVNWQYGLTGLDPPKVAAAYNSGGLYRQDGPANRWKLRNHPVGHSDYIDNFVAVFDEAFRYFSAHPYRPRESFAALFARDSITPACVRRQDDRDPAGIAAIGATAGTAIRQPQTLDIGSDLVLASLRPGALPGAAPGDPGDDPNRLAPRSRARIPLQSRISGRFPDDPAFRVTPPAPQPRPQPR